MFKLSGNFNIKAEEAKCIDKKKENRKMDENFSFHHSIYNIYKKKR
jgi:hypothetical protein